LLAWSAEGPAGTLPLRQAGVEISRSGVLVTALAPNPDGAGTVLRLWEQAGQSGECVVRLPAGLATSTVQPVDLRGTPLGAPLPVTDGSFRVSLQAFAPVSLRLSPGAK
jgi:alpha-mannosidase